MQMQMPDMPHRILNAILIVASVQMLAIAGGGWVLYQSALSEMDATAADAVQRLEEKIDANGEQIDGLGGRIDRNADLIRHNGELIAQLRERTAAVEVRVGGLEEAVRFFQPPESRLQ